MTLANLPCYYAEIKMYVMIEEISQFLYRQFYGLMQILFCVYIIKCIPDLFTGASWLN